ncbi:TonB-dependent receptor [Aliifodinibius sp. S!AR15-10]|uniref:TonB-dependent receptor n=1 Tax=Aliifodinibius sp. S!AR15-10 TaxID=2950437 RepID=UPI00285E953A|nr:TonB-dependent receptor [Aliifodinibius sp. S!AR15-10]MDR8393139.1 TonB-dependent receptor [Aliifodinibius sp. S!AR15-10]
MSKWPIILAVLLVSPILVGAQAPSSVYGYITELNTGDYLISANIAFSPEGRGTTTNSMGYYELNDIAPGTYTLVSTYIGYKRFEKEITLLPGERLRLDISLEPMEYRLQDVVVESKMQNEVRRNIGIAHVSASLVNDLPSVVQTDLFRSLQLLPGITSASDFSSGLYVRGGSPDQTLILLDNATVYNPSHFFGFYSTFNPSAIGDVNLYKGNYPSQFGERLGSVISINSKEGSQNKFGGTVDLGLLALGASLEGPLGKNGSWMLAMRRSTLEPMLGVLRKSYEDIPEHFYFTDLNGKVSGNINPNNKVSLSFYSGLDNLVFPVGKDVGIDLKYGNQIISSKWRHILSDNLFTEINISNSRYYNFPGVNVASTYYERSNGIHDVSVSAKVEYLPEGNHEFLVGLWIKDQTLSFEDREDQYVTFETEIRSLYSSLYLQDNWMLFDNVMFSPGVRINQIIGGDFFRAEPRLSFEYRPIEPLRLQAAYGQYSQFMTLISNDSFTGLDVWLTATDQVPPAYGDQFALGIKTIPRAGYKIDAELYYRTMSSLFEPDPFLPDWSGMNYRDIFRFGKGYAYGIELFMERHIGDLTGFMGYTYSVTRRRFPNFNEPLARKGTAGFYPTRFDRSHDLNLVMEYQFNAQWSASTVFSLASGQPFTKPLARSKTFNSPLSATDSPQIITGKVHGSRLPPYHRLDLSCTRTGTFWGVAVTELQVQVINVYSRRNIWFYNYNLDHNLAKRNEVRLLPLMPSISYSIKF